MTISADTLALLIEQGIQGDALVAIVRSMEADRGPAKSAGAERQRRYRERVKAIEASEGSDVTDNVTRDVTVSDASPSLDKETSPRPPKEINPIPRATNASARGTVLPVGWRPTKLGRDTASGEIIERRGQDWARRCLETFENHWRAKAGKDATKRDWQATWANWVIEQDRRDGRNGSGNRQHSVQPSGIGRTAEAALDVFGAGSGGPH